MTNLKFKEYNYFKSTFDLHESSNGWFRLKNPFTSRNDASMGVNFENNVVLCHRTGYRSSVFSFIAEYEGIYLRDVYHFLNDNFEEVQYKLETSSINPIDFVPLPDYWEPLYGNDSMCKRAVDYLESRGLDIKLLDSMGFGVCTDGDYWGYLIVPFRVKGILKYYLGRDLIGGNRLRYKNPKKSDVGIGKGDLFFNQDALKYYRKVCLVEGWSDAVTIGDDAISSQGWSLTATQKSILFKSDIEELIIIPDKGFYRQAVMTAWDLSSNLKVSLVSLENFTQGKDVNEIGKYLIFNEIQNREEFSEKLLLKYI